MMWLRPPSEGAERLEGPSLLLPPCLPGHSGTGQPTMASDHQTKVGTTSGDGVASSESL